MDIKIEKAEAVCEKKVVVTVEGKEWADAQAEALVKLAKNVEIKGFRKGHAPLEMAKKAVSEVKVMNEAGDRMIDKAYNEVVSNKELRIAMQPALAVDEFTKEKLVFNFVITTMPEVTLGEYKGLTVEKKVAKVLAKDVDAELANRQNQASELEIAEAGYKSAKNDTVILDFKGYVDGKEFEGGNGTNYELVLGSNTFIPGFEDQLIGKEKGEKVDVDVTFPEQYAEQLAGKKALFKCTINEIKRKITPELNDDFAKELDIEGVDTLEQLKESIKKDLKAKNEAKAIENQENALIELVENNATMLVSDKIITAEAESILKNFEQRLESQGLKMEDYYKMTNNTKEKMLEQAKDQANKEIKHVFVFDELARKEDLKVTNEEVEAKFAEFAKMYNMKVEDVKKNLSNRISDLVASIKEEKVVKFLKENNNL